MPEPMSPDLARKLRDQATPGPWIAEYSGEQGDCVTRLYRKGADAALIAAAPDLAHTVVELHRQFTEELNAVESARDSAIVGLAEASAREQRVRAVADYYRVSADSYARMRDEAKTIGEQFRFERAEQRAREVEADILRALDGETGEPDSDSSECPHDIWTDQPESDTWVCDECGHEGSGVR